jgi:hypothetical protein
MSTTRGVVFLGFLIGLLFLSSSPLPAQYERPGSSTAQFLDIGISPRAEAMAGSYVSVAEGAEGAYYNPAVLARIDGTDVALTFTKWFADINHEFISVAHNFGELSVALSATALQTGEMEVRTPLQPDGTGETFSAGSYRFGISIARSFTDHVSIGITGNYIRQFLYRDFSEGAYAGDIALLYDTGLRNLKFGFLLSNFGSNVTFVNESYPMPTSFTFGISVNALQFEQHSLLVTLSAKKPNDGKPRLVGGMEYNFDKVFFVRGGYHDDEVKTFDAGMGVKVDIDAYSLNLDYSYSAFRILGGAQRIGLSFHFQ